MSLDNVQEAARGWEAARSAASEARNSLVEAVRDARRAGHSLAEIAAVLGVSRQYVEQLSGKGKS